MQGRRRTPSGRLIGVTLAALAALTALAAAARLGGPDHARAADSDPNLLLIVTDDQTVRDLGVMSRTRSEIAAAGVSFSRAYISYPLCCPSRATLLTGQYAHNHGVLANNGALGGYKRLDDRRTLPVWLQRAGYRTIHIGKMPNGWGLGAEAYVPPGWSEFYGYVPDPPASYYDFKLMEDPDGAEGPIPPSDVTYEGPTNYQTDVYRDKAVARIASHFGIHGDRPLYMEVQFLAPHGPHVPAIRHQGAFASAALPRGEGFNERYIKDKPAWLSKQARRFGPGLIAKIANRFRQRLETLLSVDEAVGAMLDALQAEGELDNTYVIFISDNGYSQGQHRIHQGKFVPYEPSTRVPLLIRGPGIPAGSVSRELVMNVDVAPTLVAIAGASPTLVMDGRSLLRFARNPGARTRRPLLLETGQAAGFLAGAARAGAARAARAGLEQDPTASLAMRRLSAPRYSGIRIRRYLLVNYADGGRELYDMARDRFQLHSVFRKRRYRRVRRWLQRRLRALVGCRGADCRRKVGKPPRPLPKRKKKRRKRRR